MLSRQKKYEYDDPEVLYKRARIFVRTIYRNDSAAAGLSGYISTLGGVRMSKANPLTGKLLVIFDEELTNEDTIRTQIYSYVSSTVPERQSNIIDLNSVRSAKEPGQKSDYLKLYQYRRYTDENAPYHSMDGSEIEETLNTNLKSGLTDQRARSLIDQIGSNVISEKKRKSIFAKLIGNLFDFSTRLLLGVGAVSLLIGQIPDAAAIFGIAVLQTVISTVQEYRAESSLFSLKNMIVHKAKVIRDGKEQTIVAKHLVPGDIILVEGGDKIPADARIIECADLQTTEAMLTGESVPVSKNHGICGDDAELAERHNMLFMGTSVLCGRAKAVVTATGMNTEIGKIAFMLHNIREEQAPVKIRINRLTNRITKAAVCFCLLIIGVGLLSGRTLAEVLIMSICFSIGAIPESLPAVVNVSMALSVQRMANKNAIVRSLPAVETLGSTDVICCDKTGTLTMNEMTVKKIYTSGSFYEATGAGYNPQGRIILKTGSRYSGSALEHLLKAGVLCNNARLSGSDGKWTVLGDPTEGALLTAAYKYGLDVEEIGNTYQRTSEIPFDSARLCMTVEALDSDTRFSYCKGAFSRITEKCSAICENGKERLFTATDLEKLRTVADDMGDDALRVLAFAYKKLTDGQDDPESGYVFLGIVGMEDPARDGARESIEKCRKAGVKVVMITGDNKNTAAAIGRELGLLTDGTVVTGSELDCMTNDELRCEIDRIQIFARTCPAHKHRIVKALKDAGHIVAMIGDGVNDAPAMKEANIGVAMGRNGSDVAKDVAEITLVDDEFSTIVDAIQEGRAVTNNIRNSVKYLLSGALGEISAVLLAAAIFGLSPLLSIQMLWVNVISETVMGSSLAVEPSGSDVMNRPPGAKEAPLLDRPLTAQIVRRGAVIGMITFGMFGVPMLAGLGLAKARTMAFTGLILSQLINVYNSRANKKRRPTLYMNAAALASAALLAGIIYFPPLQSFFKTTPLSLTDAAAVGAASSLCVI